MIFRSFRSSNEKAFLTSYKSCVLPILEYCSTVWNPQYLSDIDRLESVQRNFTRRLFWRLGKQPPNYLDRLQLLNLQPLELRRIHSDLALVYKILHRDVCLNFAEFFQLSNNTTRGHDYKLFWPRHNKDCRKHFYSVRVIQIWNSLPAFIDSKPVMNARTVGLFLNQIKKLNLNEFLKFDRNL